MTRLKKHPQKEGKNSLCAIFIYALFLRIGCEWKKSSPWKLPFNYGWLNWVFISFVVGAAADDARTRWVNDYIILNQFRIESIQI